MQEISININEKILGSLELILHSQNQILNYLDTSTRINFTPNASANASAKKSISATAKKEEASQQISLENRPDCMIDDIIILKSLADKTSSSHSRQKPSSSSLAELTKLLYRSEQYIKERYSILSKTHGYTSQELTNIVIDQITRGHRLDLERRVMYYSPHFLDELLTDEEEENSSLDDSHDDSRDDAAEGSTTLSIGGAEDTTIRGSPGPTHLEVFDTIRNMTQRFINKTCRKLPGVTVNQVLDIFFFLTSKQERQYFNSLGEYQSCWYPLSTSEEPPKPKPKMGFEDSNSSSMKEGSPQNNTQITCSEHLKRDVLLTFFGSGSGSFFGGKTTKVRFIFGTDLEAGANKENEVKVGFTPIAPSFGDGGAIIGWQARLDDDDVVVSFQEEKNKILTVFIAYIDLCGIKECVEQALSQICQGIDMVVGEDLLLSAKEGDIPSSVYKISTISEFLGTVKLRVIFLPTEMKANIHSTAVENILDLLRFYSPL